MKVYLGPFISHWTTRYVEEWYLEKMHGKDYWDVDDKDYTKLDKAVIWLLDKWQDVLNATVNNFFRWRGRKEKVRIDGYDIWSADHTLALIIHPILVKLKEALHGSPNTDDEDVPEELRSTAAPTKENDYDTDDNHHKRWEWIIDEMIWAFAQILDDNADNQFHTGTYDVQWKEVTLESGKKVHEMVRGPNDTHQFDKEGYDKWNDRINNGLRLFGKYYRGLWD
jgi:hypothetical protein